MLTTNEIVFYLSEAVEARKSSDEEKAFDFFQKVFQNSLVYTLSQCKADYLIGISYLQMLRLNIPQQNNIEFATSVSYYFLSKSIRSSEFEDKFFKRLQLIWLTKIPFISILSKTIKLADIFHQNRKLSIKPDDIYDLMFYYDSIHINNIIMDNLSDYKNKQIEIESKINSGYYDYFEPTIKLDLKRVTNTVHDLLFQYFEIENI